MSIETRSAAASAAEPPAPLFFVGDGGAFLGLMFKGALLQLVTFGFYRFWFITNIRRRLWSDTILDGDALEYTGRGKELLIGFLFALAILAPIYVIYFIVGLEVESYKAFASLPLFLAFYLFGQFATFRARRYRLTRTVWRGVRFWMTGSGVNYALRSSAWALVSLATLGGAAPWRTAALERYKMRNTHYGDLQGRFENTGWALFKTAGWMWVGGLVLVALPWLVILFKILPVAIAHPQDTVALSAAFRPIVGLLVPSMFAPFAVALLWPFYLSIEWRWWLDGLRLGEVKFASAFPRAQVFLFYLGYFGVLVGAGIVFGVVAALISRRFGPFWDGQAAPPSGALIASFAGLYLIALAVLGAFYRYIFQFQLWRSVMKTLRINCISAAANVAARGEAANAIGEGLADGLDLAGF